ncbi:MAG: primosomal protein N' [Bacillota bacterium]
MKNIASVIISNSTRKFDKEYHYIIPDEYIDKIVPGIRVIVPFGSANRLIEAYVFDVCEESEKDGLKEINRVVDQKPVISPGMIKLAKWMKQRYICTYSDVVKCMLPPGIGVKSSKIIKLINYEDSLKGNLGRITDKLREYGNEMEYDELKSALNIKGISKHLDNLMEMGIISIFEEFTRRVREKQVRVVYLVKPLEEVIEDIESNRIKNIKHIRILEMLIENEYIAASDIIRFAGVSQGVLETLRKYEYIDYREIEVIRDPVSSSSFTKTLPLIPTEQQEIVLSKVKKMLDEERFKEVLLHGITGSGKTEVYLQLIKHCIDKGKQAIVLVPEISLTPQMVERFKGRFGDDVAVLHSRLSLGERYDQWRLVKDEKVKVVVGARSAVFAPFKDLGLVIIDEEHENSYKSEITPKYHAADIAAQRCALDNAVLIYGSATPSVETYFRAKSEKIELVEMTKRANNQVLPQVQIVDMRNELSDGNRSVFSRKLHEEIRRNIDIKQQTIIFLNRRGYASFILCRSCGYALKCPNCNVSLTYHAHDERLICHYCGYTIKNPKICPKCKSSHIKSFGTGTQKIEEELKKHFEDCKVIRMDMDTTTHKNSHENILKSFRDNEVDIMVGTQMIAKGHDFPKVTLVGVLAADSLLNTGDYKATERTFQLITQVAGRAGRGELSGRVVIQTYNTENFSIICACNQDYTSFYNKEILLREKLLYPPFTNLASILVSGTTDRLVLGKAVDIRKKADEFFGNTDEGVQILGPSRAPLSKIKNKYRWRIVIKCRELDRLINMLTKISDGFYSNNGKNSVALSVDINPVNML